MGLDSLVAILMAVVVAGLAVGLSGPVRMVPDAPAFSPGTSHGGEGSFVIPTRQAAPGTLMGLQGSSGSNPRVTTVGIGVPSPQNPAVDPVNGYVYVAEPSGFVSVLNGTSLIATLVVGFGSSDAAYDPANGDIYVPNLDSNLTGPNATVSVIQGLKVIANVTVSANAYTLTPFPEFATYDPADGYMYVEDTFNGLFYVLNGTHFIGVIPVYGAGPIPVYDARDGDLYFSYNGGGYLGEINGTTVVSHQALGQGVAGLVEGTALAYNAQTGLVYAAELNLPAGPLGKKAGVVYEVNGTSVSAPVSVGGDPVGIACGSSTGLVYVTNANTSNVTVLNGTTVVATIAVGSAPFLPGANPGNGEIYVPNSRSDNLSIINGTQVIGSVTVGSDPTSALVNGANGFVYVPDTNSSQVSVLLVNYTVTVSEQGLRSGSTWWFNVTGSSPVRSNTTTLALVEPDGSYRYLVGSSDRTYAAAGGTLVVRGNTTVPIQFTRVTFPVRFEEAGLPSGTPWSVTLGLSTNSSTGAVIGFVEPNETIGYQVAAVPGWVTPNESGGVRIEGEPVLETVNWTVFAIVLTVEVQGLPAGDVWWFNLSNGRNVHSVGPSATISLGNGSYQYALGSDNRSYQAAGGSVTVYGRPLSVEANFTLVIFQVTFTESGLPNASSWTINLGRAVAAPVTASLTLEEPNGTYLFRAESSGYLAVPTEGSFTVNGTPVSVPVVFIPVSVTFLETGLPGSTNWSVTFGDETQTGTGPMVFWGVPIGTYPFSVGPVPGYVASVAAGTINVSGSVNRTITFQANPAPSNHTIFLVALVSGVGIVAVAGVIAAALVLRRSRRRGGPSSSET
jgi:YVTN family beta-propeller protein